MSEATIYAAINAQVNTLPGLVAANVAWIGASFTPEAETPYIAVSMPFIAGKQLTIGVAGVYEFKGILQVSCAWPIGAGVDNCLAQRDAVRALFPNGLVLPTSDGFYVKFMAATPKPLLQDGAWLRGIVQMPWMCHEVTA